MKPNLTVNMGLRWDFVSPDKDRTGKYHSLTPQDLFGPTAVGKLFQPGAQSLIGTFDPVFVAREASYGHWNVTPQPSVGVAWTPRSIGATRRSPERRLLSRRPDPPRRPGVASPA